MPHVKFSFVGDLTNCPGTNKRFGGARHYNIRMGTTKWYWGDDSGKVHTSKISNSYYVSEEGLKLLYPYHWSRTQTIPSHMWVYV